ncbi:hypothetical protein HYG84_09095 [Alkaliphilus sp. B6464]|nr:hypothetical protein HYG84_09095 [Alkaliphilus sp. B6464]
MFIAVFLGMLFGQIKFGKFRFGVSGTLFLGLIVGWLVVDYAKQLNTENYGYKAAKSLIETNVISQDFFNIFLILFIASVGLLAAKDMGVVFKKYGWKFIVLGFLMTLSGAIATYGVTLLSSSSNPYEVSGVYTGALTSSPGLAAAIETANSHASDWANQYETLNSQKKTELLKLLDPSGNLTTENTASLTDDQKQELIKIAEAGIGIGHAVAYPFGVMIVIIAVNLFPRLFNIDINNEKKLFIKEIEELQKYSNENVIQEVEFDLTAFIIVCLTGFTLGSIKVSLGPLGNFSLGITGGVLIASLLLGYIGKIGFLNFRMNNKLLAIIRQLSLAFFLAIVGLRYGSEVFSALTGSGAILAIVSIVVKTTAMLTGLIVGKYIFKINWVMLSGAICGTSTPGLGAAIDAVGSDDPAKGYGAIYPFALLGIVIFTIILHNMPF